jgi:hypothetical protein
MTGSVAQLCAIVTHTNHSIHSGKPVDISATETFTHGESVVLMVQGKKAPAQSWELGQLRSRR